MNIFFKYKNNKTYLQYFLSYFLILSTLMVGFFMIIKSSLEKRYYEQLSEVSISQIDSLSSELTSDLYFLNQINTAINSNPQIILSRYASEKDQKYTAWSELNKYDAANKLINTICYVNKLSGQIVSTQYSMIWKNEILEIQKDNTSLYFDPAEYFDTITGNTIFLANSKANALIYFPAQSSDKNYFSFYLLDSSVIKQRMKSFISDVMPSIAFIDQNKTVITGINSSQFANLTEEFTLTEGIYKLGSSSQIYVCPVESTNLYMISLISDEFLSQQLSNAFSDCYLLLFLLSIVGFILIHIAMRSTYIPLHRLAEKILPPSFREDKYVDQLDTAFETITNEKELMERKFQKYQLSIKKSLLDTVLTSSYSEPNSELPDITPLFDSAIKKDLFVIRISPENEKPSYADVQKQLQELLSSDDACILLKKEEDNFLLLVNYVGDFDRKSEQLIQFLEKLHTQCHCLSAISNSSSSPMSIPSLCENAIYASRYWPKKTIVDYRSLPPVYRSFSYPHEHLAELSQMLDENRFSAADSIVKELFLIIEHSLHTESPMPDFFIRNILLDLLTSIVSHLNLLGINNDSYVDLYYETLYFCRSCPYIEKSAEIAANISKLLEICAHESKTNISAARLQQLIEASCYSPNFSIYELADQLNISFTYASTLVKKKLNQNFSDYLWTLRLEKAKELLNQTNMSVNEITAAVGYTNTSSFIRKFKQETGVTPSEFRQRL